MIRAPWFYIDAATKDDARRVAEDDGYTVRRVSTVGRMASGLVRFRVYVSEGRGV